MSAGSVSDIANAAGLPMRQKRTARALEDVTPDLDRLKIEDWEGEPRVSDINLGKALGYLDPRSGIRQLIQSHKRTLSEKGLVASRKASITSGKGRISQIDEYLLDLTQISYLITRCGLPSADHWCSLIADVFAKWQQGSLHAVDLQTAVELQDVLEHVWL